MFNAFYAGNQYLIDRCWNPMSFSQSNDRTIDEFDFSSRSLFYVLQHGSLKFGWQIFDGFEPYLFRIGDRQFHTTCIDLQILSGNVAYHVAHTNGHRPREYFLTIFGYPYHMNLRIVLSVRAYSIPFHTTILHETLLRLKAMGFHHPRGGH